MPWAMLGSDAHLVEVPGKWQVTLGNENLNMGPWEKLTGYT